jgi:hypothetical protein
MGPHGPGGCLPAPACGVLCPGPGFGCLPMFRLPGEHNDSMRAGSQQPAAWHFSQRRCGSDRASWTRPLDCGPPSRRRPLPRQVSDPNVPSGQRRHQYAGTRSRGDKVRPVYFTHGEFRLLPLPALPRGEGRGEEQQQTPEQASAPHPNPLPIEADGERECAAQGSRQPGVSIGNLGERPRTLGKFTLSGSGPDSIVDASVSRRQILANRSDNR